MRVRVVLSLVAFVATAVAVQPAAARSGGKLTSSPLGFGAAMDGTVAVKGHVVGLDVSCGDKVDVVDLGGMLRSEAVSCSFSELASAYAGHRVFDVDCETGSGSDHLVHDVLSSGPHSAVVFEF